MLRCEFSLPKAVFVFLLLSFADGVLPSSYHSYDELSQILDGRIVGGLPTTIKKFPFMVSVQADERPYHLCGGSIIADRWILTAAHCTVGFNYTYYVRVGSTYTYEGGDIYEVSYVYSHPNFTYATYNSDIALLKLSKPIRNHWNCKISVNLPKRNEQIITKSLITVSGWGETMNWNTTDDALRYVHLYTLDYKNCAKNFSRAGIHLTPTMFCAGYPGGKKDACSGDSGGPVIYKGKQIGIVSAGIGCADEKYPGLYTRVYLFRDWIRKITGI